MQSAGRDEIDGRQRARRDLPRARLARRLPARAAGRHAARRHHLPLARHLEGPAGRRAAAEPATPAGDDEDGRAVARSARQLHRRTWSRAPPPGASIRSSGASASSSARSTSSAAAARTTRSSSATRASARRRSSRASRCASTAGRSRRGCSSAADLRARHGRADRRHQVPRRVRGAPQGRPRRAQAEARRHPLHRRDPHRRRRRRDARRLDGRVEPAEAGARLRRAALHRRDHLPGLQAALRARSRARPPLPEDRADRAERRGDASRSCAG